MSPALLETRRRQAAREAAEPTAREAAELTGGPGAGTLPPGGTNGSGDDRHGEPEVPRPVPNAVLGTLALIGAETMLFAGFVSGFWVLRLAAPVWPPPLQPRLPLGVTGANTLVLLASSVAMALAVRRARRARPGTGRLLGWAALLGGLFLLVQGIEWARLIHFGLTAASGAYGATFYTVIGLHAAHVVGALAWVGVAFARARRDAPAATPSGTLLACAIYWHFVVALWPILYLMVYVL